MSYMGTIRKHLSWRIFRSIIGQAATRSVATIFYLHYGALCFCVGFIIGADNPYYNLWTTIKITAFTSTGLATAALLAAATDHQEGTSRPRRANSPPHEDHEVPFNYYRNNNNNDSSARVYDYNRDTALNNDR